MSSDDLRLKVSKYFAEREIYSCDTCRDTGEVDETLGGFGTSDPHAPCPDCQDPRYVHGCVPGLGYGKAENCRKCIEDMQRGIYHIECIIVVDCETQTCECAKEKFNFEWHERWCPDYRHPFDLVAEVAPPKPNYLTSGDIAAMVTRIREKNERNRTS